MEKDVFDIFIEHVSKLGYSSSITKVKSLIKNVSDITNQSIDEVIRCSDFKDQDLRREKLESIIAELRSVVFLDNNNFKNIKLIKSSKKKPSCDIYAENLNRKFDIEVTCLTNTYSRPKEKDRPYYILDNDKFLREFTSRIKTKVDQLNAGVNSYKMIIFTMNHYPEKALTDEKKYRELIKKAYSQSRLGNNYYLGLITTAVDFIYPN